MTWAPCARLSWEAMTPEPEVARILIEGAEPALQALLEEWLSGQGCRVVQDRPDLILVDLPLPRQAGADLVKRLSASHPGTPLVALSSIIYPRVEANGGVARALGVNAVLPKPLARDALVNALAKLLPQLE